MRQRMDKLVVDVEITKVKVIAIEKMLLARHREHDALDGRVHGLEWKMKGMWLVGAVTVAVAAVVGHLKGFFS